MTETPGVNELKDAVSVDPFQVGKKEGVTVNPKGVSFREKTKQFLHFPKAPNQDVTEDEIKDLLEIDSDGVSFDDIREWATSNVIYYESMGEVRMNPKQEKEFQGAKAVNFWLDRGEYRQVVAFFLQEAKNEWRWSKNARDDKESVWKIIDAEDAITVPWSVQRQGDTAIRNFLAQQERTLTLRRAFPTSMMYLRQASVLARMIDK